jgi:hypothetical protein
LEKGQSGLNILSEVVKVADQLGKALHIHFQDLSLTMAYL